MVRSWSCQVIYYFDTPALGIRYQYFDCVIVPLVGCPCPDKCPILVAPPKASMAINPYVCIQ